jgi:hypothetical protein
MNTLTADDVRDLLTTLVRSDQQTNGQPQLNPAEENVARAWLERLLADTEALLDHLAWLSEQYQATFEAPVPRNARWLLGETPLTPTSTGFRHHELLSDAQAQAVAERGIGVLDAGTVARLLLNPVALSDLHDLIGVALTDAWMPVLAQVGQGVMDRHGLVAPPSPRRPDSQMA